jgi:hypothetical protein
MEESAMTYQITFENTLSKPVQLQVNTGNGGCDTNQNVVDEQVAVAGTKQINTDWNVVCYRRTADPDNPGPMTGWVTFSPDDTNTPATIDIGLI